MCPSAFAYVASQPFAYRHIGGLLMSERRPLGSNAENLTEESVTSEQRVLRLASIVAFVLGAILVAIVVYRYVNGGGLSSPIGAGLGAMVIAGICYQIANRGRDQREGQPREESPKIPG